jgi:hypothetical protein
METIILLLLSVLFIFGYASKDFSSKRIMPWLCLEFCDETPEKIALNLGQIAKHREILAAVSFEKYTLGPNSTLVDNHLTEVSSTINALRLEAWPLLSSFPHPPEFMDWMRQVFVQPAPFINSCIAEAKKYHYAGYNLDWEPTDGVLDADAKAYADFIDLFADALHKDNLKLSVDVATWSKIWNYTAISSTSVDRGISMGTYTSSDSSFSKQLDLITIFGPRAGVGLETTNASSGGMLSVQEVEWRFEQIVAANVTEVDLWRLPVPATWWPILTRYFTS